MLCVDINSLDIKSLNALIDKGERFYVFNKNSSEYDDGIWETNYAFWGGGESETPPESPKAERPSY